MSDLIIPVGVRHLERGFPRSSRRCPLALAIGDFLRARDGTEWETVRVSEFGVYTCWDFQAMSRSYRLSAEAATFVTLFDSGQRTAAAMLAGKVSAAGGFLLLDERP